MAFIEFFFTIFHNLLGYMYVTLNIRYDLSAINVKQNKWDRVFSTECHFYAILHKTDWLDFILNFRFTRNALEFIWSFNFSQF